MYRLRNTLTLLFMAIAAMMSTANAADPYAGKTLCMLGDSYVRNHKCPPAESWHAKLATLLGMNYVNWGRNGSSIAFDRTAEGFGPAMTQRYLEMPDTADYVIVIAGHNDADYLTKHGGWDKFSAGLEELCTGLQTKYPTAKIGFVTPWGVDRPNFKEVTAEIHRVCQKYNIPVLDTTSPAIIDVNNPDFRAMYFQRANDTAHLNNSGHNLMIGHGQRFLDRLTTGD